MSQQFHSRDESLSPAQAVLLALLLVGFLWLAWIIGRWIVETREGKIFAAFAGVVLGVFWLAGAFVEPQARTVAPETQRRMVSYNASTPASAGRLEVFSSGPAGQTFASMTVHGPAEGRSELRRVRGGSGFEICTTLAGQTRCAQL